jgi:NADP-dependent 3-hydroxy acid dehydrogenase YdfG
LVPDPQRDYYSNLFANSSRVSTFNYSVTSQNQLLPVEIGADQQVLGSDTSADSSTDLTIVLHLDSFGQTLASLADFESTKAVSSLWTVFDNIRALISSYSFRTTDYRLILLHHGQGDFGRRSGTNPTSSSSSLFLTYVSALSGMLKSVSSEFPSVHITVVDISTSVLLSDDTHSYLDLILSLDEPEKEYSINEDGLYVHTMVPCQASITSLEGALLPISFPNCILAIGGARGIAVPVLERLGSKTANLVVTGRSDNALPHWYLPGSSVPQIRSELIKLHRDSGVTFTPASIEREVRRITSSVEAISTLNRLSDLYASVTYIKVDLLDSDAHALVMSELEAMGLQVDTVINVAGIIEDSLVSKKRPESFERVLSTKMNALKLAFAVLDEHPVAKFVNYSSIAGKTGNYGQADYSAANELINAGSWLSALHHPGLRVTSFNWGPWASSGMATQEVNDAFAERGIIPIPLDDGADCVASILTNQSNLPLEVTSGIYDSTKFTQSNFDIQRISESYPFLGHHSLSTTSSTEHEHLKETYKLYLDPLSLPYISSHRKFGQPVLPAASSCTFALEAYQRHLGSSSLALGHSALRITTDVLSGIVFNDFTPRELLFEVTSEDSQPFTCRLRDCRSNRYSYRTQIEEVPHSDISSNLLSSLSRPSHDDQPPLSVSQSDAYDRYLFHDGVMTVISGTSLIFKDSQVIISTLRSHGTRGLLGVDCPAEGFLDPSLLDGLLQMGLIILRDLYQTSALPNRLVVDVYAAPVHGKQYLASGRIVEFNALASKLYYEGLITTEDGSPLLCLSYAEMTHSPSMID